MRQPLIQLRQRMADHGFAACLIPTTTTSINSWHRYWNQTYAHGWQKPVHQ